MKIRNVTTKEIQQAADAVRAIYLGNIKLSEVVAVSASAKKGERGTFRVRLGVFSSHEAGARRSGTGRRLPAACWHAFGHFFDALPSGALIDGNIGEKSREAGAPWIDRNIGSIAAPMMMSQACDCEKLGHAARRLSPVSSGPGPAWVNERVPAASVAARPYDYVAAMMMHEGGELDDAGTVRLFAHLIQTGMAWRLQGNYGREAKSFIERGIISKAGTILIEVA